ncbi:hypothetical protein YC2023_124764 [Brassica napus]
MLWPPERNSLIGYVISNTGGFQPNIAGPADRGAGAEEHRVLQRARLRMDTLDLAGWGTERVERDRGSLERESAVSQQGRWRPVLAFIGDGSFQVTAQDVSTMLRNGQKTIIFLINNGGYTIEVEIHDGPYNVIKNWNYTGLVDAIHNGEGKCWTAKVRFEEELVEDTYNGEER